LYHLQRGNMCASCKSLAGRSGHGIHVVRHHNETTGDGILKHFRIRTVVQSDLAHATEVSAWGATDNACDDMLIQVVIRQEFGAAHSTSGVFRSYTARSRWTTGLG